MTSSRRTRSTARPHRRSRGVQGKWVWDTLSLEPTSLAQGVQSASDLLLVASLAPAQRKGAIITRIVGNVGVLVATEDLDAAFTYSWYTQTLEAFQAGAIPETLNDLFNYMHLSAYFMHNSALTAGGYNRWNNLAVDVRIKRTL